MDLFGLFTLMGGIGLFLYGMSIMSTGLKDAAGEKMRTILKYATSNPVLSVLVGITVTLLIQSSSATDMMVISFVNSGLMELSQAIGVIMGANIGTTITAQITAFNIGAFAPMFLFVGVVMFLFLKKDVLKHIGTIIMGFGMLFFGISIIKGAIIPLSQSHEFITALETLSNPALAILFGVLFTALLQSSSSSVVIFQTFAVQGLLKYDMTVYLVIGAAIGSVTPNLLASLTTNRDGKRTAILNLLFNLIRAILMVLLIQVFPGILTFIQNLTPGNIGHQVANTHTIFAILSVILVFPFAKYIVSLSKKVVPMLPSENRKMAERQLLYMVERDELPSSVVINQARMEIARMARIANEAVENAITAFLTMDENLAQSVLEAEDTVDYLTEEITNHLIAVRTQGFLQKDIYKISQMILVVSDIERISDHAENIVEYIEMLKKQKISLSTEAKEEMEKLGKATLESLKFSSKIFETEEYSKIKNAKKLEHKVNAIQKEIIKSHTDRLMKETCHPTGGIVFVDMANDLERCSDHAINIATALASVK
ncbi:MAG: Na/Pi cotransporter family protein [Firmicutes bacterium]|nr:Na/Pi cotransporter family protein [Bacillota bacterium]